MHFHFQRPQTSKSRASHQPHTIRDRSPLQVPNLTNPPTFEEVNQQKKWEKAA